MNSHMVLMLAKVSAVEV
uniref:Uncharacterized protein n=1 Tax=Rhizophora mucronata TaxID=61149 RepID=A0A2P2QC04_RHIMU